MEKVSNVTEDLSKSKSKKKSTSTKTAIKNNTNSLSKDDQAKINEANKKLKEFNNAYNDHLINNKAALKDLAKSKKLRTEASGHIQQTKRAVSHAQKDLNAENDNTEKLHYNLHKDLKGVQGTLVKTKRKESGMWSSMANCCSSENITNALDETIDIVDATIPYALAAAELAATMGANKEEVELAEDIINKIDTFTNAQKEIRNSRKPKA